MSEEEDYADYDLLPTDRLPLVLLPALAGRVITVALIGSSLLVVAQLPD